AEGRSQIDIIRDLLNSGFDLVRLAARSENTSSGSIKIDEGIQLFEYAREIMMASACAAVRPRAVFHARKPQQANEYMEKARLGQTEHGSYVLTILSPVAPQLNAYSDTSLFPDEPFERQVMRTLTRAVGKAVDAAEQAATHRDFSPFQDAVSEGVSANLCEAMAGLFKIGEATEIGLSVAWAQNRPAPSNAPSSILITRDVVPAIAEAARIFRATDTLEAYLVQGPVVKLERSGDTAGRVTILANIEEVARKVVVELSPQDYDKATQAHREFKSVQVVGNVKRDGRSFCAFNAARFDVVTDEDEAGN
ncbi:MAG: hypothetical protein JWQ22_556, partial [Devosia sp.]|nr:hypothetical protein [Devosia sp.]